MELLAPEVEEAIAQSRLFGELGVAVDLERQRIRRGLHDQLGDRQLDLAGRQPRVDRGRSPRDDLAAHGDHALEPQGLGGLEQWARAVEHALRDPVVIAKIQEQEIAVVALAMEPAREPDGLPGVLASELAAGVGPQARHRRRPCPRRAAPAV